jgi:hypothetical protein
LKDGIALEVGLHYGENESSISSTIVISVHPDFSLVVVSLEPSTSECHRLSSLAVNTETVFGICINFLELP